MKKRLTLGKITNRVRSVGITAILQIVMRFVRYVDTDVRNMISMMVNAQRMVANARNGQNARSKEEEIECKTEIQNRRQGEDFARRKVLIRKANDWRGCGVLPFATERSDS